MLLATAVAGLSRRTRSGRAASSRRSILLLSAPLGAAALTGFMLIGPSLRSWFGAADHCPGHGHHAHVCFAHPASETDLSLVAMFLGATLALALLCGLTRFAAGAWRSWRLVRRLRTLSAPGPGGVRILSDPTATAFSGWGEIFVSTGARAAMPAGDFAALIAHERAHRCRSDPLRTLLVELLGSLCFPRTRQRLMSSYLSAVERECDDAAAREHGPEMVASALVACVRAQRERSTAPGLPAAAASDVESRVRRLLTTETAPPDCVKSPPPRAVRRVGAALAAAGALTVWLLLPVADAAHHLLESLLGLIH